MLTGALDHEVNPEDIDTTVARYLASQRSDVKDVELYIKQLKENAYDSKRMTTGDKNSGRRLLGSVPVDLLKQVEEIDPDTFRDREKARKFFRTFSQFAAVDKKYI